MIESLPEELIVSIISNLDPKSLLNSALITKNLNRITKESQIWKILYQRYNFSNPIYKSACLWKRLFVAEYRNRLSWMKGNYVSKRIVTKPKLAASLDSFSFVCLDENSLELGNIVQRNLSAFSISSVSAAKLKNVTLVLGTKSGQVSIWSVSSRNPQNIASFSVNQTEISSLDFNENIVVVANETGNVILYGRSLNCTKNINQEVTAAITCTQIGNDMIVAGSCDGAIRVWDLNGNLMKRVNVECSIYCLKYDEKILVLGGGNQTNQLILILDMQTLKPIKSIVSEEKGIVTSLAFDNEKIVTGSSEGVIKVQNRFNYETFHTIQEHQNAIWDLWINRNLLVSSSLDQTIIFREYGNK